MSTISKNFSVVIPTYNESENFSELYRRLRESADKTNCDYELLFVDDGSSDDTLDLIRKAAESDPKVTYISFSRNFGHQIAVSAGLEYASKDAVIVMDGDLQDPPELIPRLLNKWKDGWDVVYAVRQKRKENFALRFCYFLFYRVLQKISDIQIPADSGDFCLMDKKIVHILKSMPERNRYVRGIRAWAGFKQVALPYERDKRFAGNAKYSLVKLIRLAIDGITGFSQFPLRLCGYIGYTMAFFSLLGLSYSLVSKFFLNETPQGWTSTTIAIFFIGGVQLVMLSIVGNYVGRIYTEVQRRPLYILKESNVQNKKWGQSPV